MSQPFSLNKFEKEKRVIEMYLAGKTIREISKEVHMSFRDISKIIKAPICNSSRSLCPKSSE